MIVSAIQQSYINSAYAEEVVPLNLSTPGYKKKAKKRIQLKNRTENDK